jgi:pimeloyl-ACP methyl ester carboxylesterase
VPYRHTSDGLRIRYEVHGPRHGAPVLLVQGLGTDSRGWVFQRRALTRAGHRVVTVDNRGVGRSDKPLDGYDLERMALDCVEVLDDVGIERAHVVGASMGGVIAQIMAVRHPDRLASLVLACTACRHHDWRRELFAEWADVATREGMRAWARTHLRWIVGPRSLRRFGAGFGWLAPVFVSAPAHAFTGQLSAILAVDDGLRHELAGIDVPTLVVVGSQDTLTPQADAEELAEHIPGARLAIVRGGPHAFMVEAAPAFNRVVLRFLAEQASDAVGETA